MLSHNVDYVTRPACIWICCWYSYRILTFMECTAISMSPPSRASSISLVNSPLPPMSARGWFNTLSPVVLMITMSKAPSCASSGNAAYRHTSGRSWVFLVTVNQQLLCHALLKWDADIALQFGGKFPPVSSISQTQQPAYKHVGTCAYDHFAAETVCA